VIDRLNVFECLNQLSFSISNSSLSSPFLKHLAKLRVLNLGWPFNRGKDNRKPLIRTTKGGRGRFIEVASWWGFYFEYFTDNNFGTFNL